MIYYLPLFLILSLSSILEIWGIKNKHKDRLLVCCVIFAILFIGLRFYTGADWKLYIEYFYTSAFIGNFIGFENGYHFLNNIIFHNTGYYYILQLIASCFIIISAMSFFKKNSKYPIFVFSLFIFFFLGALMSQIRQNIALGFIFISAQYIFERRLLHFLLLVFFACQFHISAIIALPLYFMCKNYGKATLLILIIVSQISYLFPGFIVNSVELITPYLPPNLSNKAQYYLTRGTFFIQKQEIQTGVYYIASVILAIFVITVTNPRNAKEHFFINTLAIATCIKGISLGMVILERFVDYYIIFGIISYSLLIFHRWQLRIIKPIATTSLLIAFFAIPFWKSITSKQISQLTGREGAYRYIPYYNVFFHPEEASQRKDWNE